ncbi:MAG: xanthine dehydrogenase family protein subunit M [Acidimicrobiales bacterium]
MKAAPFRYHAPSTVAEAVDLLTEHGDEAKVLAGGQSLVPIMALRLGRYGHLVDLNRVDGLRGVEAANGHVRVGAMTTQSAVEHDPMIADRVPLVAAAAPHIGHFQIRNRGTVGGSIAHADPAAELPAVAMALDAVMEVGGPEGAREVRAADFFTSMWTTSLADNEILTAVRFPVRSELQGFAVSEVARRHGDFALVGTACAVSVDGGGVVTDAAIALFGVGPTPVRAASAEEALVGTGPDADLGEIGRLALSGVDPNDDVHASGDYRRRAGAAIVARALGTARDEARGGRS